MRTLRRACCSCRCLITISLNLISTACTIGTPVPTAETIVNQQRELVVKDSWGRDRVLYSRSDALLIGNTEYRDPGAWPPLPNISNQLVALRVALEAHGFHVVVYENLTANDLRDVIDSFFRRFGYDHEARLVFYYAGHGATREDREGLNTRLVGYAVPVDAPKAPTAMSNISETDAFVDKAIRFTEFLEWAESMEAKHVLLVFDSCFSGSILGQMGVSDDERRPKPSEYIFSAEALSPVRWFLTSGTATQTVPAQSVFTDLLIQAISGTRREADQNHDGFLTTGELVNFLKAWVPEENPNQTPQDGKLRNHLLNIGDVVFKLPTVGKDEIAGRVWNERLSGKLDTEGMITIKPESLPKTSDWDEFHGLFPEGGIFLKSIGNSGRTLFSQAYENDLQSIVSGLESNLERNLNDAQNKLARLVSTAGPAVVSEIINGIPQGSYHYQLGVASALANTPGWRSSDLELSKRVLENARDKATDRTLKATTENALKSAGH
jgi:Caspase domain